MFFMDDKIGRALERVTILPHNVEMLFRVLNDPTANAEDLAAIVNQDPMLAMQALHLCNSAYYSLPVEVTSVLHAIMLLGVDTIAGLAMAAYFQGLLDQPKRSPGNPWLKETKDHILETAQFSEYLVKETSSKESPSTAFTAGLLHDIGKLALSGLPSDLAHKVRDRIETDDIPLFEAEQKILGIDHAEVGWLLAQRWKVPEIIEDAIRYHHTPFGSGYVLSLLVYLSNTLVHAMVNGEEKSKVSLSQTTLDVLQELDLSEKDALSLMDGWVTMRKSDIKLK